MQKFIKYQGTGNDFVVIDNRNNDFPKNAETIHFICQQKFGIGSDGLILIENNTEGLDFTMLFYNPDGSQSFCGNGSRCAVHFAHSLGMIDKHTRFLSTDGEHEAYVMENSLIKLKMNDVPVVEQHPDYDFLNTGSPHYVTYTTSIDELDIVQKGRAIRYDEAYKSTGGTNVNYIEDKGNYYKIRTYERGVENETLSCGTGVTASALSIALRNNLKEGPLHLKPLGGDLWVDFRYNKEKGFTDIWLTGAVAKVFEGEIDMW